MTNLIKTGLAAVALASLPLASACSKVEDENPETATKEDSTVTLAAALGSESDMNTISHAISESDLAEVFDGPASYTLLAPNDAAFDALGKQGSELMTEEQRPMLVAVLRDHLLPGHLTPEAIEKAIAQKGGPVTMTTFGEEKVTFSQDGDTITVSTGGGSKASVVGTSIAANNGVVIPLDTVLLPPKEG